MPLPKNNRLVHKKDIDLVFKQSKSVDIPQLRLRGRLNTEGKFRLLISVSKKISKKANKRNQIRRKISNYFEYWFKQKTLPQNFDLVIIVKQNILLSQNELDLREVLATNTQNLFLKLVNSKKS